MSSPSSMLADLLDRIDRSGRRHATFLLGTDRHIGAPDPDDARPGVDSDAEIERRVGVTPSQLSILKDWLATTGITLRSFVIAGAGARAGFPDFAYRVAGAEIVDESDIATLPAIPDVVHALKEPTFYESTIPGPFIRVGALHIGDFSERAGLARMFEQGNWAAIVDGSYLGGVSHRLRGGFDVPLRKTMSDFAGDIAAHRFAGPRLAEIPGGPHRVVVVGAGVAGSAAVRRLLGSHSAAISEVLVIEPFAPTRDALRNSVGDDPRLVMRDGRDLDRSALKDAGAVVVATFRENAKDFICQLDDLGAMKQDGVIVDVSCDEGPSIGVAGLDALVGEAARSHVREAVAGLGRGLDYVADTHLPRMQPQEASDAHGCVAVPYLAVLLQLCAAEGGAAGARDFIRAHRGSPETHDVFDAFVQDLRRGMVFTGPDPVAMHVGADPKIEREIDGFVRRTGRRFDRSK